MRALAVILLLAIGVGLLPTGSAAGQEVLVARVDGVVSPGTAQYLQDAVDEAESRGVPLVVELDTPGGLVDATLEIQGALDNANVPVLTYVGPGSAAYAASAGTFLLLMGEPNGMAQGTSIGSAQPIQVDPAGGSQNASGKVVNFLVERIRSIAENHGRDPDVAEAYIRENLNQNATAARDTGMVDVIAPTTAAFLDAVDGRPVDVQGRIVVLDTDGARIVRYEQGLLPRTLDILSNPTLAFIFMIAGVYSLVFGLANPGTYVPETIGAILLLLGFIGLGLFGIGTAGFLLVLLAVVFFVAEVFTPTNGLLTAAGVVLLVLAGIFLIDGPLLPRSFVRTARTTFIGLGIVSGGVVFAVVTFALRTRNRPTERIDIGARGVVTDELSPEGRVEVWGEVWSATAEGGLLPVGTEVEVVRREGLHLFVRGASDEEE